MTASLTAAALLWGSLLLVFYAYLGYPALVGLLARLRPRPGPGPASPKPTVTLLIAAYNEETAIGEKIENSLALEYPPDLLQIIVAADGSTDGTPRIVRSFAERGVTLSFDPVRAGKMAAINRAMELARGEIVVFSDANNLYDRDALDRLAGPFGDPRVGAATGAKKVVREGEGLSESEGLYWRYESYIKEQESRLGTCAAVAGEIFAVRRSLFRPPPPSIINDDFYLAMDIAGRGYRIRYVPGAVSRERVSAGARGEVARRSRIIAGRYQAMGLAGRFLSPRRPLLAWQVVSHKFIRPLVPFAMAGALAGNVLLVLLPFPAGSPRPLLTLPSPLGEALLLAQACFYAAAAAGNFLQIPGAAGRLLYLPTFLVNSNLAALLGLYGYLSGKSGVLWKRVERR